MAGECAGVPSPFVGDTPLSAPASSGCDALPCRLLRLPGRPPR